MEKKLHQVVESLLDSHVNIESINYQNTNNILHIAATNADHKMLELMLKRRGEGHSEILSELANQVNEKGILTLIVALPAKDMISFPISQVHKYVPIHHQFVLCNFLHLFT